MPEHDLLAMGGSNPAVLMLLVSVRMSLNPAHRQTQRFNLAFSNIFHGESFRAVFAFACL